MRFLGLRGRTGAVSYTHLDVYKRQAVARASGKYQPPMQLIGKLYRDKAGWVADWAFVDGGKVLSKWTTKHADACLLYTSRCV